MKVQSASVHFFLGSDDEDEEVAENGLKSRKAMHEQYQITSQNDMDRKGGKFQIFKV